MTAGPLPYLETFVQAAESSSFTAAAKSLGLSQAAVSQRVQALEQALGVSLFQRRGGRVLLTDAGKRLHAYAQRILSLHEEARQEIAEAEEPSIYDICLEGFDAVDDEPFERAEPKLGRNELCWCGSGKKYKKCHLDADEGR